MNKSSLVFLAALLLTANGGLSAVVGTNLPAQAITSERLASLPHAERGEWTKYFERSEHQRKIDQAFMRHELQKIKTNRVTIPPSGRGARSMPVDRDRAWYASAEARKIADIVLTFQTPAGGWSKNIDMSQHLRAPGEHFASDNATRFPTADDNDAPHDFDWNYVGTFDNDATTTQLRFLARVITALGEKENKAYREAFARGITYVLTAQYPNGGWPQVWPLQGGYHDSITYNDGGMIHIIELLSDIADGEEAFGFTDKRTREHAKTALDKGLKCLLATQVVVNGRRTVWGQQHDALTLKPTSARNYEMPSLASGESAEITTFLMRLPKPSDEVVSAIDGAAAWFAKTQLRDVAFRNVGNEGRRLISDPGSGPLWSRYYEIGTDHPIFGDRDKSIHDDVNEISPERRRGYSWFSERGRGVLEQYKKWQKARGK